MKNSSKHSAISRQLATEIIAGKFRLTGRLPSEAQFVKRFGVSRPRLRALKDLQDQGLIERRQGSGTYVRTETARGGHDAHSAIPQLA